MENKELETGLLVKAINNPYISKNVISKNPGAIFRKKYTLWIAQELVSYYYLNDILINEDTLKEKIKSRINRENLKLKKLGKNEIPNSFVIGTMNYITELFKKDDNNNPEFVSDLEKYVKNSLTTTAILEESTTNDDTLAERVEKRIDDIKDISLVSCGDDSINIIQDIDKRTDIYENNFNEDTLYTGLKGFDVATGGIAKKEVACIGAASGSFKTGTMANLAYRYSLKGYNVLYVALEGREADMLLRFDKLFLNVNNNDIFEKGKISDSFIKKQEELYKKANENHKDKPLNLVFRQESPNTIDLSNLEKILVDEERTRGIKFDVMFVDYADLLKKRISDNEASVGEQLFQGLARIASQHDLLVWTGSQLNRSSNSAEVKSIENVEGSYRKINVTTFWATINVTKEEREQGYIRFHIDKIRNQYGNYNDDFIYMKLNQKTYKLEDESKEDYENHLELISGAKRATSKEKVEIKKEKEDDMIDFFNKQLQVNN
ncbi:MAG TPA: hypothetical protein K8V13_19675 [Enterobacter roggenkampii]|nr:hypothetical protein [Enterobacter roggenkampii]